MSQPSLPPAKPLKSTASPVEVRDASDPGDTTQRNFRYQHAYGVMLMVGAKLGIRPYVALWCEQHEDFLAERSDKKFDGIQVKTSRPEFGAWKLNDHELIRTIGRFADLVDEFGDQIGDLFFVSNTECETAGPDNTNDRLRSRCPGLFIEYIRSCKEPGDVVGIFKESFLALQAECGCSEDLLFEVLRRVQIVLGPSRNEMDAAGDLVVVRVPELHHRDFDDFVFGRVEAGRLKIKDDADFTRVTSRHRDRLTRHQSA